MLYPAYSVYLYSYAAVLAVSTHLYFRFELSKVRPLFDRLFSKEYSGRLRSILPNVFVALWAINLAGLLFTCVIANDLTRIFTGVILAGSLLVLNFGNASGIRLIITVGLVIGKLVYKIRRGNKQKKIRRLKLIQPRNAILLFLLVGSFSFCSFVNRGNIETTGRLIIVSIFVYLILIVWDSVRTQYHLIGIAEFVERMDDKLQNWDTATLGATSHPAAFAVKLFALVYNSRNPNAPMKGLEYQRKNLRKAYFWSKYAVSLLRTYLLSRIVISFLLIFAFTIIAEGNYLQAAASALGESAEHLSLSSFYADAFYRYTVNQTATSKVLENIPFFQEQRLWISILGWAQFVLLIVLVMDLFSTSYSQVYNALSSFSRKFREDAERIIALLEKENPDQVSLDFVLDSMKMLVGLGGSAEDNAVIPKMIEHYRSIVNIARQQKKTEAQPPPTSSTATGNLPQGPENAI